MQRIRSCAESREIQYLARTVSLSGTGGQMEAYAILSLALCCQCVRELPAAAGLVTVAGRHAEVPPSGLRVPHSDLARARVRMGEGKDKVPDDLHAVV